MLLTPRKFNTKITPSQDGKSFDVYYTTNGSTYILHKSNFKSLEDAMKETVSIKGSIKLLEVLHKVSK